MSEQTDIHGLNDLTFFEGDAGADEHAITSAIDLALERGSVTEQRVIELAFEVFKTRRNIASRSPFNV